MLRVNQLIGFGAGGSGPIAVLNRVTAFQADAPGGATTTFETLAIGTASATRLVVAFFSGTSGAVNNTTVSSATIGGVTASIDAQANAQNDDTHVCAILSAVVPTGTTADVVVNTSHTIDDAQCTVVAIDCGGTIVVHDSATDSDTGTGTTSTTGAAVDFAAGGYVAGVWGLRSNTAATTSWTGLTKFAETNISSTATSAAADVLTDTASTGNTVSLTYSSTSGERVLCVVSYKPA